jgi:acetyl-CoA acetyltransferase
MADVMIAGAGMTRFGKTPGLGIRALATEAAAAALQDAGLDADQVERIYFGNAAGATVGRQDMVRGQVAFRYDPLSAAPILNVENACASGGSAFLLAQEAVRSGIAEVVLAVGAEQLSHVDRGRSVQALRGSMDITEIGEVEAGPGGAATLMQAYAGAARGLIKATECTVRDFARVAVKNRRHATLNPHAHFHSALTLDDVMAARVVADPLTLTMCSPITDGSAALVVCSTEYARRHGLNGAVVRACRIAPGRGAGSAPLGNAATAAYEVAGLGPDDLDLVELHDAAAPAELIQYAELGLCEPGAAQRLVRDAETDLGGRIPVNVSGGLMSRGHPLGATGCAQLFELYTQLLGRAQARQVDDARIALAANAGGWVGGSYAVGVATVLEAPGR